MLHSFVLAVRLSKTAAEFSRFIAPVPLRFKKVLRILHNTFPKT
jgi:hypothetical protein